MRQIGRREWKRHAKYYRQALAEGAVFHFKTIFGTRLHSRRLVRQITEAKIKCAALNRVAHLGMARQCYPVHVG